MKVVIALVLCFFISAALSRTEEEYQELFFLWQSKFNRVYASEQFDSRYLTWKSNFDMIEAHNAKRDVTYKLACNEYCDGTWEEFKTRYNLDNPNAPQHCSATAESTKFQARLAHSDPLPPSIDWRQKNVVTPVKNQGGCGSCWSFSSTGCLESWHALKTGNLVSLSEQQLLDCSKNFDNHGCAGGLPSHSFEYIKYSNGLMSEQDYPYTARDGACKYVPSKAVAHTEGSYNVTQGDEEGIHQIVGTSGPVSIAYQVVSDFRFYHSGVYQSTHCKNGPMDVNHAVLAVGYNTTAEGIPYWIVKNSWGTSFGINGYFWIIRNKNMCGLAVCASRPLV